MEKEELTSVLLRMTSVLDFAKKNLRLTSDPKLHFRSITLTQLHSSNLPIPSTDITYWSIYSNVFDFPSDVPILIPLGELRKALRLQPQNIANLINFLVSKLEKLVRSQSTRKALIDREYEEIGTDDSSPPSLKNLNPIHPSNSFASQLRGFGQRVPSTLLNGAADLVGVRGSHKAPKGPSREILNCVRVLTRILPLLLEEACPSIDPSTPNPPSFNLHPTPNPSQEPTKPADKVYWINNLLWGTELDPSPKAHQDLSNDPLPPSRPQFVIDEDEDEPETARLVEPKLPHPLAPSPNPLPSSDRPRVLSEARPPLLATLIETILDLLFLPGLTIPVGTTLNSTSRYPIWTGGIGSSQIPPDHSQSHNSAKVEVLRLLLVVLSKPLYSAPHLYSTFSPSVKHIIGSLDDQDPLRAVLSSPNPSFTYLSTKTSKPLLLALLCSLINTSLAPTKNAFSSPANAFSTLANGLGRMTQGKMGFVTPTPSESAQPGSVNGSPSSRRTSLAGNNSTPHYGGASTTAISEGLPGWCAAVLSVLLLPDPANVGQSEVCSPTPTEFNGLKAAQQTSSDHTNRPETNGFRTYLSKLHRPTDLSFLIDNILVILMKPMTVTSQLLASESVVGSSTLTNSFLNYGCGLSEAMLLLYLSLDCNPRLISYLISTQKISTVMIALTFICLEQKDNPKPKIGLVKLCAVTLQLLTASERKELSHLINSKVELPIGIRAQYSVPGTLADFLIVSICSVIFSAAQVSHSNQQGFSNGGTSKSEQVNSEIGFATTYTPLVLTFTNLSPYIKDLSSSASTRLCQLFLLFSTPGFLLSEEGNVRLLYYVLETFNNIIHYQMPDNPHLIYSIIKVHQRFENLATFTLHEGLKEIDRVKQRRQQFPKLSTRSPHDPTSPKASLLGSRRGSIGEDDGISKVDSQHSTFGNDDHQSQEEVEEELRTLRVSATDKKGKGKMTDQVRKSSLNVPLSSSSCSSEPFQVIESRKSSVVFSNSGSGSWTDLNQFVDSPTKAAQAIGKNGFIPTESWVASWRDSLPLDTIQIMLSELKPKVMREGLSKLDLKPDPQAINLLKSATLIGILPKAPKRSKRGRRFELISSKSIGSGGLGWIGSFVWSLIFIKDSNSIMGTYFSGGGNQHGGGTGNHPDGSSIINYHHSHQLKIRLFGVKILPRRSSSLVLGLFKPFSSATSNPNSTPSFIQPNLGSTTSVADPINQPGTHE